MRGLNDLATDAFNKASETIRELGQQILNSSRDMNALLTAAAEVMLIGIEGELATNLIAAAAEVALEQFLGALATFNPCEATEAETQDLLGKAALVSALGSYTGEGLNTAIEYAQIAARVLKAEKEGQPTECQEWKVEVLAPIVSSDNPTNLIMKYNGLFSISEEGDLVGGGDGTLSGTGYIKTGDCPGGVTYPVEVSFSFLVDGNLRDVNGVTSFQFSTLTGTPLNVTVNAACGDSSQLALDEIKGMIAAGIGRLPEPMRQVKAQDGASTVLPLEPAGSITVFLVTEK